MRLSNIHSYTATEQALELRSLEFKLCVVPVNSKSHATSPALASARGGGLGRKKQVSEYVCLLFMCLLPETAFAGNLQAGAFLGGVEVLRDEERETIFW